MFVWGKKKYDKIYKLLSESTQDICDVICKYGYKDKAFQERHIESLLLIFTILCHIVKNYYRKKYSFEKSETVCKYMLYQFDIRVPNIQTESLIEFSSEIITTLASYQQAYDDDLNEEWMSENMYIEMSKFLIKRVCFYDTYFFDYDKNMINDISMLILSFENKMLSL